MLDTLAAIAAGALVALAGVWTGGRLARPPEPREEPPEPSRVVSPQVEPWEPDLRGKVGAEDLEPEADDMATPGDELPDYGRPVA